MAHITEIKIEGLLGRSESITYKLNRHVNIFFGENGCGKTTLLKVLDAALSRDGALMESLPVSKAIVDIYSIEENKTFRHVWERNSSSKNFEFELFRDDYVETLEGRRVFINHGREEKKWKITPAKKTSGSFWAHTFLPTTRLYFSHENTRRSSFVRPQISENELDQAFSESVNKSWLQFYSKTINEVRSIQEFGFQSVLKHLLNPKNSDNVVDKKDPEAIYKRVVSFLERQKHPELISLGSLDTFTSRYNKEDNLRQVVNNLYEVEEKIEFSMIPINKFMETISRLFSRGKKLKISNNELQILLSNNRVLPISHLSSGEKHLIKILLSAMSSGANSTLIDEPELSMHIDWQNIFVETILSVNPECQLILASHSPEIMANIPDECIFKI